MIVSACLWGLRETPAEAAAKLATLGLDGVDVEPGFGTARCATREAVTIKVNCLAADHLMPPGGRLGDRDPESVRIAKNHVADAIREASILDAEAVYVCPPSESGGSMREFEQAVVDLAGEAASFGMRFCIEHVPGSNLGSAMDVIEFSMGTGHPNVYALVDIGHCLLAGENPADVIRSAADRLGYIHLDDNDGISDLHLPLTDGKFSASDVREILESLQESSYKGPLSIEVKNDLDDPLRAVETSLRVLVRAESELQS